MGPVLIAVLCVVGLVGVFLLLRWLRVFGAAVKKERAQEMFKLQRERLEAQFLQAASATGKPRGLIWKDLEFSGPALFVRERKSGHIAALVGVTIQFEAVEGGEMEDVAAVAYAKNASAVFFFHGGQWTTVGKAVFNMNPDEALRHFSAQYDSI